MSTTAMDEPRTSTSNVQILLRICFSWSVVDRSTPDSVPCVIVTTRWTSAVTLTFYWLAVRVSLRCVVQDRKSTKSEVRVAAKETRETHV